MGSKQDKQCTIAFELIQTMHCFVLKFYTTPHSTQTCVFTKKYQQNIVEIHDSDTHGCNLQSLRIQTEHSLNIKTNIDHRFKSTTPIFAIKFIPRDISNASRSTHRYHSACPSKYRQTLTSPYLDSSLLIYITALILQGNKFVRCL